MISAAEHISTKGYLKAYQYLDLSEKIGKSNNLTLNNFSWISVLIVVVAFIIW